MGGALMQTCRSIDISVSGEGERAIDFTLERTTIEASPTPGTTVSRYTDLTSLPTPNYDDFFAAVARHSNDLELNPRLVIETSRGCWWGERSHCTFCGLNGGAMEYRVKSAPQVLEEIRELRATHGNLPVDTVDNILALEFLETLFPELAKQQSGLNLFFETKSNLKLHHLKLLRDAGVTRMQPGIESLSDSVLQLMRKGVPAALNVQFLRNAKEVGIWANWNYLWGFPGEDPDEYENVADLIPLIHHLPPPVIGSRLRLDRYSPLYQSPEKYGLREIRPYPAYRFAFPQSTDETLYRLAYYFVYCYNDGRDPDAYTLRLSTELARWRQEHGRAECVFLDDSRNRRMLVLDTRDCATKELSLLCGLSREILLACREVHSSQEILAGGRTGALRGHSANEYRAAISILAKAGLLLEIGGRFVSLPVSLEQYQIASHTAALISKRFAEVGVCKNGETTVDASQINCLS
jgi:ribosomal peptide maturation radical SAM protein 1